MMVRIAIGTDLGAAKTVEIEWKKLSSLLSRHEESKRKGGKFFVGGHFTGTERREASMVGRSLLTLDADDTGMTLDDIELQLTMGLDCSFAAYTTYNHSAGKPKLRIVVPLSREVTPDEYRQLSNKIGDATSRTKSCSCHRARTFHSPGQWRSTAGRYKWTTIWSPS
jgi:hypothetical protein